MNRMPGREGVEPVAGFSDAAAIRPDDTAIRSLLVDRAFDQLGKQHGRNRRGHEMISLNATFTSARPRTEPESS
jgi:hypothetical protein